LVGVVTSMGSDATEGADIFKELAAETMVEEVAIDVGLEMGTMRFLAKLSVP
jgi:hypothetical protein